MNAKVRRRPVRRLRRRMPARLMTLWLGFGLLGSLGPSLFRYIGVEMSAADATYREIFGYSTIILIAFGIFLSAVGDIFVDDMWAQIGGGILVIAIFCCVIAALASGMAIDKDVNREFIAPLAGNLAKAQADADPRWAYGELALALVLISMGGTIKARLWRLSHP